MMSLRRVAIYGGTFDPVHKGHIEVARRVLQLFELDEVRFVPAYAPPHKRAAGISSGWHRFAMLALATEHEARLRISTIELDEPDRPYAVDTVARMQDEVGADSRLFFLIGADSWSEITTWHEWQRLLKMCDLIVVSRPGYELGGDVPEVAKVVDLRGLTRPEISERLSSDSEPRTFLTDAAMVDVSASRIRAAVQSKGQANDWATLKAMVPATVASYIEKYELYQN